MARGLIKGQLQDKIWKRTLLLKVSAVINQITHEIKHRSVMMINTFNMSAQSQAKMLNLQ